MQIFAIVVSFALTIAAVAMLVPAVRRMLGVIRSGQPAPGRNENPAGRAVTMLKETFLHTRMLQWHWVGIMHWFVYAASCSSARPCWRRSSSSSSPTSPTRSSATGIPSSG